MYKLQLSNAACVLGYFRENGGRMVGSWSARKSGPDRAWSSEFEDYAVGLHVRLNSSQCVSQIAENIDGPDSPLVRRFNISGAYHPETAKMNMGPVELSFGEAQILKQIASTSTGLGKTPTKFILMLLHFTHLLLRSWAVKKHFWKIKPPQQQSRRGKPWPRLFLRRAYFRHLRMLQILFLLLRPTMPIGIFAVSLKEQKLYYSC